MAQQERHLLYKSGDPCLTLRTQVKVEGENDSIELSSDLHTHAVAPFPSQTLYE